MSPQEALVEIERTLDEHPNDPAMIRAVLADVQPRYWLPAVVDTMVAAYLRDDLGAVHRIIREIVDRDHRERGASR